MLATVAPTCRQPRGAWRESSQRSATEAACVSPTLKRRRRRASMQSQRPKMLATVAPTCQQPRGAWRESSQHSATEAACVSPNLERRRRRASTQSHKAKMLATVAPHVPTAPRSVAEKQPALSHRSGMRVAKSGAASAPREHAKSQSENAGDCRTHVPTAPRSAAEKQPALSHRSGMRVGKSGAASAVVPHERAGGSHKVLGAAAILASCSSGYHSKYRQPELPLSSTRLANSKQRKRCASAQTITPKCWRRLHPGASRPAGYRSKCHQFQLPWSSTRLANPKQRER